MPRSVVVFSPGGGHAQRLLPLVTMLVQRGLHVHVMTRPDCRTQVEAAGGRFFDLFTHFPMAAVDQESIPLPSRHVTFAASYVEPITAAVAELEPCLVIYDSFVVVAPIVARRLGVPFVSMRAGHAQVPALAMASMRNDPRVLISRACLDAVAILRDRHGVANASPFSYLDGVSPYLNLYPEPPAFIDAGVQDAFAPIAYFGSLAPEMRDAAATTSPFSQNRRGARVYVSFGTVIWRYYVDVALAAIGVLSEVFSARNAEVVISLGQHPVEEMVRRRLERANVHVESYVDQWSALKAADLFVTHHGLNSTHEAVFHQVPMLSYPFFGDQPAMAATCHSLGLAASLTSAPRQPLDPARIHREVDRLAEHRHAFTARLQEARQWELDTIATRDTVVDRLLTLG